MQVARWHGMAHPAGSRRTGSARFNVSGSEPGFSLVETLVASSMLATALVALAEMFGIAAKSNASARLSTSAMVLAEQKMEQLRGLAWGFDVFGLPVSDLTTDTGSTTERTGGKGLTPSPVETLRADTNGYVDYLDANGRQLDGGATVPNGLSGSGAGRSAPLRRTEQHAHPRSRDRRPDGGSSEAGGTQVSGRSSPGDGQDSEGAVMSAASRHAGKGSPSSRYSSRWSSRWLSPLQSSR